MRKFFSLLLSCCSAAALFARSVPEEWVPQKQLFFIENIGQIRDQYGRQRNDIRFKLESPELSVLIGDDGLHYLWQQKDLQTTRDIQSLAEKKATTYRMDVTLVGADKQAMVIREGQQPYYQKYYLSHLGLNGTVAHAYEKITYRNVYPNIDWVVYISKTATGPETMKYDFVVRPGGDIAKIKLKYEGASDLKLNADGSLDATTPMGRVKEQAPYSYLLAESNAGQVQKVPSQFQLDKNIVSFKTGAYNGTLVIDPSLDWATYYGGAGFDLGTVLNCDNSGNVYLTGASWMSTDIATTGSHQSVNAGDFDAFLAKFDGDGNRLWATYYGGPSVDYSFGLACDQNDRVYISGTTLSTTGIATLGSAQPTHGGGGGDDFLVRFDSTGSLIWATYYGSSGNEYNGLCATDGFGHVYLTGFTSGNNNIASNGHQGTNGGGANDAFLVQFDTSGVRQWGTFYGGAGDDQGDGVACDRLGNVYLGGHTNSTAALATAGSHQANNGGGFDDFLVKFNSTGVRQWATYYGGTTDENNNNLRIVACDKLNNVFLSGSTSSTSGIATTGSHQPALAGGTDAFLVKFNSSGVRQWGTYYGGNGFDNGGAIGCDFSNNIFWCGITQSTDGIATAGAHQTVAGGGNDAYLTKFSNDGVQQFGTFYGGGALDEGYAVSFDVVGNAYISGGTASATNIATPGSFSTVYAGGIAVFLAKFCTSVTSAGINGEDSICLNGTQLYATASISGATGYIWTLPSGWTGASDSSSIVVTPNATGGVITVQAIRCDTSDVQSLSVYVYPDLPAVINATGLVLSTANQHQGYQWYLNGQLINGATGATYTASENGNYTVVVTNTGGCTDTSAVYTVSNVVGVHELSRLSNAISIYPNPANDVLQIASPEAVSAMISSLDGRQLLLTQGTKTIDISTLSSGVYMIRFTDSQGRFIKTMKFTKAGSR